MENEKKDNNETGTSPKNIGSALSALKGEFGKIIWPSREDLLKSTTTVIVTSLLFGILIFGMDSALGAAYQAMLLALE